MATAEQQRVGRNGHRWRPVVVPLLVYSVLFAVFYPQSFATPDESSYLQNAQGLLDGDFGDRSAATLYKLDPDTGSGRFHGKTLLFPALLVPLLAVDWKMTFLFGLVCHFAAFLLLASVLRRADQNPWWALLLLLHPTLMLGSRMIMTDGPSNVVAVAVVWLLLDKRPRPFLPALLIGASLFIRVTNVWLGVAAGVHFLLLDITREPPPGRPAESLIKRIVSGDAMRFSVVCVVLAAALLAHNTFLYGGPFNSRYSSSALVQFGLEHLVRFLPWRLLSLNVFWPFLFFAMFFLPRRIRAFGVTYMVVNLLFFSFSSAFERGHDVTTTLVRSVRYLSGPVAVLCVGYPVMIRAALRGRPIPKPLALVAIIGCFFAATALFWKHDRFLATQRAAIEVVATNVPREGLVWTDQEARELFHPAFGSPPTDSVYRAYFTDRLKNMHSGQYVVLRSQPPPRTPGQARFHRTHQHLVEALRRDVRLQSVREFPATGVHVFRVGADPVLPLPPTTAKEKKMWSELTREYTLPTI